jgi:CRP-like cAMP-binding protein
MMAVPDMNSYSQVSAFGSRIQLGNFEIFKDLTPDEINDVSTLMKIRSYDSGSYIISEDQNNCDVYFILSGQIRTCSNARNGKQIYFEDLYAGNMFGEFSAIDQKGRSADCLAVKESLLASLSGQSFLDIMDRYPQVKDAVMRRLVKLVRKQMQKVSENVFYNVGQRVRFEIIRLCAEAGTGSHTVELATVPTHNEIALRIGTHREAVTRELNSLQAKGLITWNREKHIVHDIRELTNYAEISH